MNHQLSLLEKRYPTILLHFEFIWLQLGLFILNLPYFIENSPTSKMSLLAVKSFYSTAQDLVTQSGLVCKLVLITPEKNNAEGGLVLLKCRQSAISTGF